MEHGAAGRGTSLSHCSGGAIELACCGHCCLGVRDVSRPWASVMCCARVHAQMREKARGCGCAGGAQAQAHACAFGHLPNRAECRFAVLIAVLRSAYRRECPPLAVSLGTLRQFPCLIRSAAWACDQLGRAIGSAVLHISRMSVQLPVDKRMTKTQAVVVPHGLRALSKHCSVALMKEYERITEWNGDFH